VAYSSQVAAALKNLAAMLPLSPALAGVEISDGPPPRNSAATEALATGYSPGEDIPAVEVTTTAEGDAGGPDREQWIIHCSLGVLSGAGDLTAARDRAYQIHGAAGDVLAADPQLRGTVMSARMGDHSLRQSPTDAGILARINFSIRVDAYSRS
jgi:hypothetical protein